MAFQVGGFSKFVREGEAKNGFEPGTAGIKVGRVKPYLDARARGEEQVLGIPQSADPKSRPVYAALENPDRSRSLQGGSGQMMAQYGGIQVVFDPSVKDRSTFTVGDSLDYASRRDIKASPVRDPADPSRSTTNGDNRVNLRFGVGAPSARNININTPSLDSFGGHNPAYVEAQIHGGLRSSDIREVRVYRGHEIPPNVARLLEKQGVRIVELPPRMRDLRIEPDSPNYREISAIEIEK